MDNTIIKVRYDRRYGILKRAGSVGEMTDKAIMSSDAPLDSVVLNRQPFAAYLVWFDGLLLPEVNYFTSKKDLPRLSIHARKNGALRFVLCKIEEINYHDPAGERAPRHRVQLIDQLTLEQAIKYNQQYSGQEMTCPEWPLRWPYPTAALL